MSIFKITDKVTLFNIQFNKTNFKNIIFEKILKH